jgi:hypothetical protein
MSQVVRDANVYFLPATLAPVTIASSPSVWRRLQARGRAEFWRVLFGDDTMALLAEQRAQLIERPRPSPARIIDFGSARARLRPLPASR